LASVLGTKTTKGLIEKVGIPVALAFSCGFCGQKRRASEGFRWLTRLLSIKGAGFWCANWYPEFAAWFSIVFKGA